MPRFASGGVQIHTTDSSSAYNIGALTNLSIPENIETAGDDAGLLYEYSRSLIRHTPVPTFTTKNIAMVLDLIGLGGTCINCSPPTTPGVRLYGRRQVDCKDAPGSSTNAMYTITDGLMVLGTLTAARGQDATISVEIHAITDGSNAPVAAVYNVALPSFSAAQYTLGESIIGGFQIKEATSVSIEFGVEISDKIPALGGLWPETVAARRVMPKVRVSGYDLTQINDSGFALGGFDCSQSDSIIQLIKRVNKGTFVAAGTSEHIALAFDGLGTVQTRVDASGNADGTCEILVECQHDGTNVPVTWDTSSTYDSDLTS